MKIEFAGATDVGKVRDHNEDCFVLSSEDNLVVVCDGMGGHAAGEVASKIAAETISSIVKDNDLSLFESKSFSWPEDITPVGKLLVGSIVISNRRVIDHASAHPDSSGMGTTVVACAFNDGIASICHVGDSRVYLVRDRSIKQLTVDHSWVNELMEKHQLTEEESKNHVGSNVITRAVGSKPNVSVDISEVVCRQGDIFLLCSDGLTGMISDSDILKIVVADQDNPESLVVHLIESANQAGGTDNITVCAAWVSEQKKVEGFREIRRITVDWDEDPEAEEIERITNNVFVGVKSSSDDTNEATDLAIPRSKKKDSNIAVWIFVISMILAIVFALLYFDLI